MPAIKPTITDLKRGSQVIGQLIVWEDLKKDDIGEWAEAIGSKRSVLINGEVGYGNCKIEGTNDGKIVGILHSDFNSELNLTDVESYKTISDISRMIRPKIVDGDENTKLTISLMVVS